MTNAQETRAATTTDPAPEAEPARKPYSPPAIIYRGALEAVASACTAGGKANTGIPNFCTALFS
ncbi:MAG: hypothetical protein HY784_03755 [Chloroflexi bacterium]|nr:hypothetical protein [Chloroflexota bacterium]